MSSKRARRRRACSGKQRHPTEEAARAHVAALYHQRGALGLNIYKCKFCGAWHVGHRPLRFKEVS